MVAQCRIDPARGMTRNAPLRISGAETRDEIEGRGRGVMGGVNDGRVG